MSFGSANNFLAFKVCELELLKIENGRTVWKFESCELKHQLTNPTLKHFKFPNLTLLNLRALGSRFHTHPPTCFVGLPASPVNLLFEKTLEVQAIRMLADRHNMCRKNPSPQQARACEWQISELKSSRFDKCKTGQWATHLKQQPG